MPEESPTIIKDWIFLFFTSFPDTPLSVSQVRDKISSPAVFASHICENLLQKLPQGISLEISAGMLPNLRYNFQAGLRIFQYLPPGIEECRKIQDAGPEGRAPAGRQSDIAG